MSATPSIEDAYRKWADDLVRYATVLVGPAEAADLVAESFASILGRGDEPWKDVREPRAYLYRTVANQAHMLRRGRRRRERRELAWTPAAIHAEFLSDPIVRQALDHLSVQQRAVIFLNYWEDMSLREIASLLSISEGSVKRQLARARSSLREVLA